MSKVKTLNDFNLPAGTSMVKFGADWCAPCKAMMPVLESLSEQHPETTVFDMDISEHMDIATAQRVMNIPCVVVYQNGKEVDRMVGYNSPKTLEALFLKHAP